MAITRGEEDGDLRRGGQWRLQEGRKIKTRREEEDGGY
jgi:hypothetical protein